MGRFTLSIDLDNDAMREPKDIARSLREVAQALDAATYIAPHHGPISDANGNKVGYFSILRDGE